MAPPLIHLEYPTRLLLSWAVAALLGVLLQWRGRAWHRAFGIGIMTVPLWMTAWNYVNSIQFLADPGSILPTYSPQVLSSLYSRSLLMDLGYVGVGFLLYASGGSLSRLWGNGVAGLAQAVRRSGVPLGAGEGHSIGFGALAFPVLLFASAAAGWFLNRQEVLQTGDESSVWLLMTPYHMLLISLAAGFGEELVYRGVLMTGLRRVMPGWIAVIAQALVFGLAHAGYGTLVHVITPTLFGLVAGVVAYRYGIWAAIVMHVLVDVFAFGGDAAGNAPWVEPVLVALLALNILATAGGSVWWVVKRTFLRPTPPVS